MTIDFNLDSPPPTSPLQRWATEQLGLPATATGVAARNTLRDRLHDEDFVPPLRWQLAVQVMTEKRAPGQLPPATVLHDEERRLQEEVGEFAGRFFDLAPPERQQRWRELLDQSNGQPLVQARLRALELGLKYERKPLGGNPLVEELADEVRDLFVLRGVARAGRRQAFLAQAVLRIGDYEQAAKQLSSVCPQLTLLEPALIEQLTEWSSRRWQAQTERARAVQQAPLTVTGGSSSGGNSGGWVAIACILGVLGALRGLTSSSTPSYAPKYSAPPTFKFVPPAPMAPPVDGRVENERLRELLQNLQTDRTKLYAELRQLVTEAAPTEPPIVERLRLLLPPEVPRPEVLSTEDLRYLLSEVKAKRFTEPRLAAITRKLADNARPNRS